MNAVVRRLVLKDLYFARGAMLGSIVLALISIPLLALGSMGRFSAMILMVCAGAAPGAFICGMLIVSERKERANLFSLSLPVSGRQMLVAKMLAAAAAYLLPWVVLLVGTFVLFSIVHAPMGMLPFATMLWVFLLDEFFLTLAISVSSRAEGWFTVAVVVCNVAISFYMFSFLSVPSLSAQLPGATAIWSPFIVHVIAVEVLVAVALASFMGWQLSRRTDFL
jgi:ABC-2 type transport system permease protein